MESFKDEQGKFWDLKLNIGLAKKIKSRLDVDLVAGDPSITITKLTEEPFTRSEMMWMMVQDCATGITQEEFDERLTGETFRHATLAFWQEVTNFIQEIDPTRARAISKLKVRLDRIMEEQVDLMISMAESPELQEIMEKGYNDLKEDAMSKVKKLLEDQTKLGM